MAKANRRQSGSSRDNSPQSGQLRGVADKLLLTQAAEIVPGAALLILTSGTALARHIIAARPDVAWNVFTLEHFYLTALVNALEDDDGTADAEIDLFCNPDPPAGIFQTILIPTDSKGSAELTRDLLQSAEQRLAPGGRLLISTNNPKDHWLHQHLKTCFGRVTVIREKQGICYIARKGDKPVKQKDFGCEFAFRDDAKLIRLYSRPGVFSHRRVDAGARALIRSLDLLKTEPEFTKDNVQRIVDMGCGCGSVAVAAGLRFPDAQIVAVDSHARAVQSSEMSAKLNDANNVSTILTSDGGIPEPGTWDLYLCNPPYYSDFRISEVFLQSAFDALRIGGRIHLVTKLTDGHYNRMIEVFANAEVHRLGEYDVIVSER